MGKIAFVFSGQGDQYPGMGKELCGRYPAAAAMFRLFDEMRPGTSEQCFYGSQEQLRETVNTQPCLYAMELAAAAALRSAGTEPAAVAGFSLGELAAVAAAGIVDVGTGFRLACRRGELMQREAEKHDTSMAAVLKLEQGLLESLCRKYEHVWPVNYNCPGQITVAGDAAEMQQFLADVKAAGGRAVPLSVSAAFHTPYMNGAAEAFAEELKAVQFQKSGIPVYSDMTARPYGEDPGRLLAGQICSPVRWEAVIRGMAAEGIDLFIEIGPGKTLANMIRRILPEAEVRTVSDMGSEAASGMG